MPPAPRKEVLRVTRRQMLLVLTCALALASALIAISVLGSRDRDADPVAPPTPVQVDRSALFRGVPQQGIELGRPDAPVTLVEYADLQCPYCAQWARDAFPAIVDEYVRTGRVRLVFRGLAFLGPDSETALRAALAAGEQNRLWDVVHGLFVSQGAENSGWVTEGLLRSFAGTGLNTALMFERTQSRWVERQLADARRSADENGIAGTPSFQAGPTGGRLAPLQVIALDADAFRKQLDRLLAR